MERYMTGERYNANLTPSFRRHWRFFVLGGIVYCFAVLVHLFVPFSIIGLIWDRWYLAGQRQKDSLIKRVLPPQRKNG